MKTITDCIEQYFDEKQNQQAAGTRKMYRIGLAYFKKALREEAGLDPECASVEQLDASHVGVFLRYLDQDPQTRGALTPPKETHHKKRPPKDLSVATRRLYTAAVRSFLQWLRVNDASDVNLEKVEAHVKDKIGGAGSRLPKAQFSQESVERVLEYVLHLKGVAIEGDPSGRQYRTALRDRALILTLADTGLRIHEACRLRRGDLDWNEGKALITGKGNQEAVIRFTRRAMDALRDYLAERAPIDSAAGRPLPTLPLFARHNYQEPRVLPISTKTGHTLVERRVAEALGNTTDKITPHSFRHYFVKTILLATGGNVRVAQELARHSTVEMTQRYSRFLDLELDKYYYEIFEEEG